MIRLAKLWLMAGLLAFGLAMPAAAQLQTELAASNGLRGAPKWERRLAAAVAA